ncbi:MAG: alpha/beta hydrolase [Pseudomonadota bacterium]
MPASLTKLQTRISSIASGLYGDWLADRGNPLAVPMQVLHRGRPIHPIAPVVSSPQSTLVLLIHGLMGSESVWDFDGAPGQNYATYLSRRLSANPLCLHYNSGRAVERNGHELNAVLDTLVRYWPVPVERIVLIGHSMGGLLIRSACHHAMLEGRDWVNAVQQCVYIGTPHEGAWLAQHAERTSRALRSMPADPIRIIGHVLNSRSSGIKNLARGGWRNEQLHPFLPSAAHYAVSGRLPRHRLNPIQTLWGDGLVDTDSAHARETNGSIWAGQAMFDGVGHLELAHHPSVALQLAKWLQ